MYKLGQQQLYFNKNWVIFNEIQEMRQQTRNIEVQYHQSVLTEAMKELGFQGNDLISLSVDVFCTAFILKQSNICSDGLYILTIDRGFYSNFQISFVIEQTQIDLFASAWGGKMINGARGISHTKSSQTLI